MYGAADTSSSVASPTVTINVGGQVICTFTNALVSEWSLFMSGNAVPNNFQQGISGAASITNVDVQSN